MRIEPASLARRGAAVIRRPFGALVALYLLALVAVAVLIDRLGDVWWPATLMMFAPRWVWGAPLAILAPIAWRKERAAFVLLAAAVAILLFPILDLRVPLRRLARQKKDLRVMTYNIGGGAIQWPALTRMIADNDVDMVVFQESSGGIHIPRMNVACWIGQCLCARSPIRRTEARDRSEFAALGGSGAIVRHEVETPHGWVGVTNVHLATPRDGLAELLRRGPKGAPALDEITRVRRLEAEAARAWALREPRPTIVMGDFNTPVESAIWRASWSTFEDAFSVAGLGFGSTKHTRWHGVRIDHVLVTGGLEVVRAWVGPGMGGDHRPLIADLRFIPR